MKGIIYRAYNKVSKKSYIGQTINSLQYRKSQHLRSKDSYHFQRALKFYAREEWEWSILEECDRELLDAREVFWIRELDTFENGYNSNHGGYTPHRIAKVYQFYHPLEGVVSMTRQEFSEKIVACLSVIADLKNGKRNHVKGWIMAEHEDIYEDLMKVGYNLKTRTHRAYKPKPELKNRQSDTYTLYHRDGRVVTGNLKELANLTGLSGERCRQIGNSTKGTIKGNWHNKPIEPKLGKLPRKCTLYTLEKDGQELTMNKRHWNLEHRVPDSFFVGLDKGGSLFSKGWKFKNKSYSRG